MPSEVRATSQLAPREYVNVIELLPAEGGHVWRYGYETPTVCLVEYNGCHWNRTIFQKRIRKLKAFFACKPDCARQRHEMVGPAHLWEMKRAFQIEFLLAQGLRPANYLVDIGCGTLRGSIPLIKYLEKGRYLGLECSRKRLDEGRLELKEANLLDRRANLILIKNLRDFRLKQRFDFVWSFSVLFHMTDQIVDECLDMVSHHLRPDGVFLCNVLSDGSETRKWKEFPVVSRPISFYENAAGKHGLNVLPMGVLSEFGHNSGVADQDANVLLRITPSS